MSADFLSWSLHPLSFPLHFLSFHFRVMSSSCSMNFPCMSYSFHLVSLSCTRTLYLPSFPPHCSSLPFIPPSCPSSFPPHCSVSLHVPFISLHSLGGRRREPAKSRQQRACDTCVSLPEDYFETSSNYRAAPYVSDMSQGGHLGGGYFLGVRHAAQCRRT